MTDTLRDRVRPLIAKGMSNQAIADKLGESLRRVQNASYVVRNQAHVAQTQRDYGRQRYGTDAYRKWDRERRRKKYHVDPLFRAGVIEAVKRYRARKKAAQHEAADGR